MTSMHASIARLASPILVVLLNVAAQAAVIIDFEDEMLAANTALPATSVDQSPIVSAGVVFNRDWNTEFDCCPSGWALSNQSDQITAGPATAYSAFVRSSQGGGFNSSQFAVANNFQQGEATIEFPSPVQIQGMYITNTTYTYLATVAGNDGAGFVKGPFSDGDWLRLDVIGLDGQGTETGRQPVFLVDYREGQSVAVDEWLWVDLTDLGTNVMAVEFAMESTDTGLFGMNTPAFFAVDDLTFRIVPEPHSWRLACLSMIATLGLSRSRTRRWSRLNDGESR